MKYNLCFCTTFNKRAYSSKLVRCTSGTWPRFTVQKVKKTKLQKKTPIPIRARFYFYSCHNNKNKQSAISWFARISLLTDERPAMSMGSLKLNLPYPSLGNLERNLWDVNFFLGSWSIFSDEVVVVFSKNPYSNIDQNQSKNVEGITSTVSFFLVCAKTFKNYYSLM